MLMQEFESRTGFYLTQDLYQFIEDAYMESGIDKDDFCAAYKNNENGMAEAIALKASIAKINATRMAELAVGKLDADIANLKVQLEKEQEWQPHESSHNVKQADYEALASSHATQIMSDREAKDLIAREFGFECSKITIRHSVDKEEVSRHRRLRKVGEHERLPLYNATDWNYIRFDCANWCYEMHNGQLDQFYC